MKTNHFFSFLAIFAIALTFFACSGDSSGETAKLCGSVEYDASIYRCEYGELVGKCNGLDYRPAYQVCNNNGVIENKDPTSSSSSKVSLSSSASSSSVATSSSSPKTSSSSVAVQSSSSSVSVPSSSSVPPQSGVIYGPSVTYEGETYQSVVIGTQTWMAENLNYNANGSQCYDNKESYCQKYGRLYNWATAKTVCPTGWHLPSKEEWDALASYIENDKGCTRCDAKHLRARSGWNSNGNELDSYGFSALPGGFGSSGGYFNVVGDGGFWWSASEYDSDDAYNRLMVYDTEYAGYDVNSKVSLFSVRCLQD